MINLQRHQAGGSGEVAAAAAASFQGNRRTLKREQFIDASIKVKDFLAVLCCSGCVALSFQH